MFVHDRRFAHHRTAGMQRGLFFKIPFLGGRRTLSRLRHRWNVRRVSHTAIVMAYVVMAYGVIVYIVMAPTPTERTPCLSCVYARVYAHALTTHMPMPAPHRTRLSTCLPTCTQRPKPFSYFLSLKKTGESLGTTVRSRNKK